MNDPADRELVVGGFLAPNIEPVYRFIVDELGCRIDRRTKFVAGESFDQFAAGEIDAGFI